MRAAVLEDVEKLIYREDYPKPKAGPKDVIVKTHYCGICGTDVKNYKYKIYQLPLIMGHEFSGEVVEIGSDVQNVDIGEKVCGINVSLSVQQGELDGLGIFRDGGFAEYVKVPEKFLFKIPENISTKEAIMIESFANAVRGVKLSQLRENENVMIIGGGNIGLCFLEYIVKTKSPNYIVVIEPHEFLRNKAIEFGASETLPPNKMKINKFIKKNGPPSFIFDCAGFEQTLRLAIDLIDKGGTVLLEGVNKGNITLPMFLLNSKELCLKGCLGHDREDILESIDLFAKKIVNGKKFISEIHPLKDISKIFNKFFETGERNFIKVAIKIIN